MPNIDSNSFLLIIFGLINFILFKNINSIRKIIKISDRPNYRKIHKKPVPILGGTYLIINIFLYIAIFNNQINLFYNSTGLLTGLILFFFLGLIDDIKPIGSKKKLIISSFFLIIVLFLDPHVIIKNLEFSFTDKFLGLKGFYNVFTILCFLLFINAFNMFDGINCQSGIYSIFLLLNLFFFNNTDQILIIILIFLIFFLYYNYQTRIFLVDGGSLTLGFLFSYFFINNYNLNYILYADEIFLLMFLPGLDMFRVYLQRLINKKNPFLPDRNHLHHYLIEKFGLNKALVIQNLIIFSPYVFYKLSLSLLLCNLFGLFLYLCILLTKFKSRLKC